MSVTFSKVVVRRGQIITINTTSPFVCSFFLFRIFFTHSFSFFRHCHAHSSSPMRTSYVCVPKKIFIFELLIRKCISNSPSFRTHTTHSNTLLPLSKPQLLTPRLHNVVQNHSEWIHHRSGWHLCLCIVKYIYICEGKGSRAREVFDVEKISSPAVRWESIFLFLKRNVAKCAFVFTTTATGWLYFIVTVLYFGRTKGRYRCYVGFDTIEIRYWYCGVGIGTGTWQYVTDIYWNTALKQNIPYWYSILVQRNVNIIKHITDHNSTNRRSWYHDCIKRKCLSIKIIKFEHLMTISQQIIWIFKIKKMSMWVWAIELK